LGIGPLWADVRAAAARAARAGRRPVSRNPAPATWARAGSCCLRTVTPQSARARPNR